jgi:hypothetical protein
MRKLPVAAFAGAIMLAGASFAASPQPQPQAHVLTVALPDGSVAHVEYFGEVAPKVTIEPARLAAGAPVAAPFAAFPDFGRMIADINRRSAEMVRQAREMARQPGVASPYIAAYGDRPAGATSTTVVSVSNGGRTCTRTTEVVSQGPGKPPKVTSNATGDCDAIPADSAGAVNRT